MGRPSPRKTMFFRMSRKTALRYGLLKCKCGHPESNHFAKGPCAHCNCKKYAETGRSGITVVTDAKVKS